MRWRRLGSIVTIGGLCAMLAQTGGVAAAETTTPLAMSKTLIVLKLDGQQPLAIRTTFQEVPPMLTIEFPAQRVIGSLPERSTVAKGVIQSIGAQYDAGGGATPKRFIRSLQIALSASYPYHVRSEAGRVVIEIEHPSSISSAAVVEVGLRGGTIIAGLGPNRVDERFRAMQIALARATPTPWTLQIAPGLPGAAPSVGEAPTAQAPATRERGSTAPPASTGTATAIKPRWTASLRPPSTSSAAVWILFGLSLVMSAGAAMWLLYQGGTLPSLRQLRGHQADGHLPSGALLVDQLVWRAFERQGFQLMSEVECAAPLGGTLRIIMKEGTKAALLFVRNGPFFEKQTVEQFVRAMREANAAQGYLSAAGSFTVPAQRVAKAHDVTLIGREELIELLSAGAASEYVTKQLEQQHARLEEAKETLKQYAGELETLRRQRNEASWHLGEERAKSAKLEARLGELTQQLHHHEAELARWEQDATALRKQWQESEWYLGESRAQVRHLEEQLSALQDAAKRAAELERARDETSGALSEERTKREALEAQLAALQQQVEASLSRERSLEEALQGLKRVFTAMRTHGERRRKARVTIPSAVVELRNGSEAPLFTGAPRNLSSSGLGLETEAELAVPSSLRLRLQLPGAEPIESTARLIWQQAEGQPPRYHSGYRFMSLPASTRTLLQELIEQSQASPS